MKKVSILDCTLRDGGYMNDWKFSNADMSRVSTLLYEAHIEYIEIGYLTTEKKSASTTMFNSIEAINKSFEDFNNLVCMINYGDFSIDDICMCECSVLCGIRVAFHKEDMVEAFEFCKMLMQKGYKVFVQPMIIARYTNEEVLTLVELTNNLKPEALYVVDSFGSLRQSDIIKLTSLILSSLYENISLGFHSHNNLQLSFSNVIGFISSCKQRNTIIDASVFGIGRGAGNLCTEMIADHLNLDYDYSYQIDKILQVYDEIVAKLYVKKQWGYAIPYMISGKYNCHPSYAKYLFSKNTLKLKSVEEIIAKIPASKSYRFFKPVIEKLYKDYQCKSVDDTKTLQKLLKIVKNKKVVLVFENTSYVKTPGEIVIGVNFFNDSCDICFVCNERKNINEICDEKLFITSNVSKTNLNVIDYCSIINYGLCFEQPILMVVKLLINIDVSSVVIVGFKAYQKEFLQESVDELIATHLDDSEINDINKCINKQLANYSKNICLEFRKE